MIKTIKKSTLSGTIAATPSKSYAHRYLMASALSNNESTITNVDFSDDIVATLNCIHAYGKLANRDFKNHKVVFSKGCSKNFDPTFDCNESGSTLRIFLPIALTKYDNATFIGSERLIERGISIYEEIFKYITFYKERYSIKSKGILSSGIFTLPGNVSSQFISGLLYALPLLPKDSEIHLTTKLESRDYVYMTLDVLSQYGINITQSESSSKDDPSKPTFIIPGNQSYKAKDFSIEGDFSNAAFIDAFNYFGSNVRLTGLNKDSIQADKIYKEYFERLDEGYTTIDISNSIDLGPILITFAAMKHGARFIGTSRLKIKESDRGTAIAKELSKCNASIDVKDNEIIVENKKLCAPKENLDSHNDHRIAMSLSLLSTQFDVAIDNIDCIKKSYPSFLRDLEKLGAIIS